MVVAVEAQMLLVQMAALAVAAGQVEQILDLVVQETHHQHLRLKVIMVEQMAAPVRHFHLVVVEEQIQLDQMEPVQLEEMAVMVQPLPFLVPL
jgi:hypothetical protein